jgi:hypothetical protein
VSHAAGTNKAVRGVPGYIADRENGQCTNLRIDK